LFLVFFYRALIIFHPIAVAFFVEGILLAQGMVICRGRIDPLKSKIPSLISRILRVHP
jgi:hypothetical protein